MATTRPFWASFVDGFTMDGIFGDLQVPGVATRIFAVDDDERQLKRLLKEMESINEYHDLEVDVAGIDDPRSDTAVTDITEIRLVVDPGARLMAAKLTFALFRIKKMFEREGGPIRVEVTRAGKDPHGVYPAIRESTKFPETHNS